MGKAADWLREERRKVLGDWAAFCLRCGAAQRWFEQFEAELPDACPACGGELLHRCLIARTDDDGYRLPRECASASSGTSARTCDIRSCSATSQTIVRRPAAEGTTVLFSTHYMEEAQQLADRLLVLAAGRLVADATPGVLRARPTPTKAKPDPAGGVCICCRSPSALERDGPLSGARRPPSPTRRGSAEDRPRSSRRRCR